MKSVIIIIAILATTLQGFSQEIQEVKENTNLLMKKDTTIIMEFKDMISSDLNPKVVTRFHGDTMLLAYYTGGKIASKVIHNEETTGKIEFSLLESKYPDDKLITETRSGLVPWYDNFFLCYGFQEIKNVALESNNKRFVFQLTKVKFEE